MKAIVENPLNANCPPMAISLHANMLNGITWRKNENELRDAMELPSTEYPVTLNSIFDYGFVSNHMRVSEKEGGKRLILVES